MRYISTRGQAPPVSFLDAVLAGMAPDGGLYVPESWPKLETKLATSHYATAPSRLIDLLSGDEVDCDEGGSVPLTNEAYIAAPSGPDDKSWRPKWPEAVTPLRQIGPGQRVALVTSAFHMRRALGEAKAAGIDAYAFPADFELPAGGRPWFQQYLPNADALRLATVVIKEWGGLVMQRMGG